MAQVFIVYCYYTRNTFCFITSLTQVFYEYIFVYMLTFVAVLSNIARLFLHKVEY